MLDIPFLSILHVMWYHYFIGPDGTPAPIQPSGRMASIAQCQLEVDLSSVVFDHHHLFSLDHYLSTKLSEKYIAYNKVKSGQASKDLDKRLEVLYQSVDALKTKQESWNENEKEFQVEVYIFSQRAARSA
jgi:hypothetical protein